jgi:hypothetical protein
VYTAEQCQEELDYLTQYAKGDWAGFSLGLRRTERSLYLVPGW